MAIQSFNVSGMTCGGCVKSIKNALLAQDGVVGVEASHETGVVDVSCDATAATPELLKQRIEDAGFDVVA
jgi:copper chaperone